MTIHFNSQTSSKEQLIKLIQECTNIQLVIANGPEEEDPTLHVAELNDYVLQRDGTLELWYNPGYEI